MNRITLTLILLLSAVFTGAAVENLDLEQARAALIESRTANDSLTHLYDIFDMLSQKNKIRPGEKILDIAKRTHNDEVLVDIIPQLANLQMHDIPALDRLIKDADLISNEEDRKGIKVFVEVTKTAHESNYVTEADRHDMLIKYATAEMTPAEDLYGDILDLYRMVLFIGHETKGSMYLEYLDRLEELLDQIPERRYYLRNLFYTTAANAHTAEGNAERAVETDRKILEIIKGLEKKYAEMGRRHRNYDRYYYLCYRRMLRNFKALTPEEVKDIYSRMGRLAQSSEDLHHDFYDVKLPTAYRLVATGDYKGAIPNLQTAIANIKSQEIKRQMLGMLVAVADSVNDTQVLLPALKEYNGMLQAKMDHDQQAAYQELQMRYEVNKLRNNNTRLELEKRDSEISTRQKLISVSLGAILLLVIALMILYRNFFRMRHTARMLRDANGSLRRQIDEMMHGDEIPDSFDPHAIHKNDKL